METLHFVQGDSKDLGFVYCLIFGIWPLEFTLLQHGLP